MSTDGGTNSIETPAEPRWRGWIEPLLLVALVAAIYGARLTNLPVRGEESRWGVCLIQMLDTGDYIVPRQQGLAYIDRPPLALWAMAPVAMLRGQVDELAIRLPSMLAIVAMSLVVYAYGRTFLGRFGALAAGLAFATMGQVLQLGRLGENEAVFTLLLCSALLAWHYGYLRSLPALAWCAGYALAALATLAKRDSSAGLFRGGDGPVST